MTRCRPI